MTADLQAAVQETARRARKAAADLAQRPRGQKDRALHAMADALLARSAEVVAANAGDVARAREAGTAEGQIDRLTLTEARVRPSPTRCASWRSCPTRSARPSAATSCPTGSSCGRCACRSAWSASSTRRGRT